MSAERRAARTKNTYNLLKLKIVRSERSSGSLRIARWFRSTEVAVEGAGSGFQNQATICTRGEVIFNLGLHGGR